MSALPVPILFETLRSVGYTGCEHPRVKKSRCQDCGANETTSLGWMGGTLDFLRQPRDNDKPQKQGVPA